MSQFDDYDDQNDDDQQEEGYTRIRAEDLKALRKKARLADDLNPKTAQMERELAFLKAKIDVDDPKMKYFVKAYDGELNAEAIRQAAIEAGFVEPPREQVPTEELRMHQQMQFASAGVESGVQSGPSLLEKIEKASNPNEIMQLLTDAGVPTTWNRQ